MSATVNSFAVIVVIASCSEGDLVLRELLFLVPLAVITNTAFPVPFEPVLLYFVAGAGQPYWIVFSITAAICAGLASLLDLQLVSFLSKKIGKNSLRRGTTNRLFYLWVVMCAFLPIPFSAVRLTLIKTEPAPLLYAGAVMAGRLPRYLLVAYFATMISIPLPATICFLVCLFAALRLFKSHRRSALLSGR